MRTLVLVASFMVTLLAGYVHAEQTDFNADPTVPNGWTVEEHRKSGLVEWDPAKVKLYLSPNQKEGFTENHIKGHDLLKELKQQPVLNANFLDYLLKNQDRIPVEWRGQMVFFWGTIYRDSRGTLWVRYMHWENSHWVHEKWVENVLHLGNIFPTYNIAVVSID